MMHFFFPQSSKPDVYSMLVLKAAWFEAPSMPICHLWHIWQPVFSCKCLSRHCVPGWWAHLDSKESPETKSPHGARVFEVAHWCFKAKFMVQGATSDVLLLPLETKIITEMPNVWKKNLYPVPSPAAWKFRGSNCSLGGNQSVFEQSHNHTWHTQSPGSNHPAEDSSLLLDHHWGVRSGESWGHISPYEFLLPPTYF